MWHTRRNDRPQCPSSSPRGRVRDLALRGCAARAAVARAWAPALTIAVRALPVVVSHPADFEAALDFEAARWPLLCTPRSYSCSQRGLRRSPPLKLDAGSMGDCPPCQETQWQHLRPVLLHGCQVTGRRRGIQRSVTTRGCRPDAKNGLLWQHDACATPDRVVLLLYSQIYAPCCT